MFDSFCSAIVTLAFKSMLCAGWGNLASMSSIGIPPTRHMPSRIDRPPRTEMLDIYKYISCLYKTPLRKLLLNPENNGPIHKLCFGIALTISHFIVRDILYQPLRRDLYLELVK